MEERMIKIDIEEKGQEDYNKRVSYSFQQVLTEKQVGKIITEISKVLVEDIEE